jgi:hypothetical protein
MNIAMKRLLVLVCAFVLIVGLMVWLFPQEGVERNPAQAAASGTPSNPNIGVSPPVGTTGTGGARTDRPAPPEDFSPATIKEIETITGDLDGHQLIGRRVDLHVNAQNVVNGRAFWVGSSDNRLLVVIARDTRSGGQHQRGDAPSHRISPAHRGQKTTISGTIQKVPAVETMESWGLTTADKAELADRKIYIRADNVSTEGHGTF